MCSESTPAGPRPSACLPMARGGSSGKRAAGGGGGAHPLGDEGGGFWIGRAALTGVVGEFGGRGPVTLLTSMILEHLDLSTPKEVIHEIYSRDVRRHTIAGITSVVQQAME